MKKDKEVKTLYSIIQERILELESKTTPQAMTLDKEDNGLANQIKNTYLLSQLNVLYQLKNEIENNKKQSIDTLEEFDFQDYMKCLNSSTAFTQATTSERKNSLRKEIEKELDITRQGFRALYTELFNEDTSKLSIANLEELKEMVNYYVKKSTNI